MNKTKQKILLEEFPSRRTRCLYQEFKHAWDKTSNDEKKKWAIDSLKRFGEVTYRRGKGLVKAASYLCRNILKESGKFGVAIYNKETKTYLIDRKDKSFDFIIKTTPASVLIKKAAGVKSGSGTPNSLKVGKVTRAQLEEIAQIKDPDLTAADMDAAVRTLSGSARSAGIEVEG